MLARRVARSVVITVFSGMAFIITLGFNADYIRQRFFPTVFEFGKKEMFALLRRADRSPALEFSTAGKRYALSVRLRVQTGVDVERHEAGLPHVLGTRALACGRRTFYQAAAACFDTTELAVHGTLTLRELGTGTSACLLDSAEVAGHLTVIGTKMRRARLDLRVGTGFAELLSSDAQHFEVWTIGLPQVTDGGRIFRFSR